MKDVLKSIYQLEKSLINKLDSGFSVLEACDQLFPHFNDLNNITQTEVLQATMSADLPDQYYRENQFGHFNVTLVQNDLFNIQIYIMNDIDTEIHDHSFTGAFKLLTGKTIHNTFDFHPVKEVENGIFKGTFSEKEIKHFSPGDYSLITTSIIHQILRLADINITLIVTDFTKGKPSPMNGYYMPPHLHIKNMSLTDNYSRKISALQQIYLLDRDHFGETAVKFSSKLSLFEVLIILTRLNIYQVGSSFNNDFKLTLINFAERNLESFNLKSEYDDYKKYLINQKRKLKFIK